MRRPVGLGPQRISLLDPEPVLLVDDDQAEVAELHPLLQQRVGADHDAGLAGLGVGERLAAERRADWLPVISRTWVPLAWPPSIPPSARSPIIAVIDR